MPYSPTPSQPDTLTEEFRTLIQKQKMEWLGNLPPEVSGDSLATWHSGLNFLVHLIEATVSPAGIAEMALNELDWDGGSVDIPTETARLMRRVIRDVIVELGEDRQNS